ncbi:MAG: hypothetical protein JSS39_17340 [Nitrospira sp.]|nr:hypothetical protein [Nitrospira sp.]
MQCRTMNEVEGTLNRVLTEVDLAQSARTYWEQNECLILDRFISNHPTLQFLAGAGGASFNRHS